MENILPYISNIDTISVFLCFLVIEYIFLRFIWYKRRIGRIDVLAAIVGFIANIAGCFAGDTFLQFAPDSNRYYLRVNSLSWVFFLISLLALSYMLLRLYFTADKKKLRLMYGKRSF